MTQQYGYPRLRRPDAIVRLNEMREIAAVDPSRLLELCASSHPRAEPVPTGVAIASAERIMQIRTSALEGLDGWLTGRPIARESTVKFDLLLGRLLHKELDILPADAAHEDTWSFLSGVVFPDVVWARFPDLHQDRVLGKRHRNTLRRAWFRYDVIGDLQETASQPLGEDEMTGLFERTQVAANRDLVRAAARLILDSEEANRSDYARRLMKKVTALTGPFLLDGFTADELHDRLQELSPGPKPRMAAAKVDQPISEPDAGPVVQPRVPIAEPSGSPARQEQRITREDPTDVVKRFHREVIILCAQVEKVLGRRPNTLLRMVGQMGGVEAARAVIGETHPSDTFVMLWEQGRLDLTLESLVLKEEFQGLFADALLEQASSRLERLGRAVGQI